jgi:hypothetical protein
MNSILEDIKYLKMKSDKKSSKFGALSSTSGNRQKGNTGIQAPSRTQYPRGAAAKPVISLINQGPAPVPGNKRSRTNLIQQMPLPTDLVLIVHLK